MGRSLQILIGSAATLSLCVFLSVLLWPSIDSKVFEPTSLPPADFISGGEGCAPDQINVGKDAAARVAKLEDCQLQAEAHRQAQADLVQQTRAANAASASAALAVDQSRIALLSGAISIVTTALLVWTLWETRSANRSALRAYIIPDIHLVHRDNLKLAERKKMIWTAGVRVVSRNTGQTPAIETVTWISTGIFSVDEEETLSAPHLSKIKKKSVSVIAPDGLITTDAGFVIDDEGEADLRSGKRLMYSWGLVTYRDVFDRVRISRFRVRYLGAWPPHPGAAFSFCDNGNSHT